MLVGPTRPRPSAASPRAAVVPTPPQAPINHKPTRRAFGSTPLNCSTPFGITDFLNWWAARRGLGWVLPLHSRNPTGGGQAPYNNTDEPARPPPTSRGPPCR